MVIGIWAIFSGEFSMCCKSDGRSVLVSLVRGGGRECGALALSGRVRAGKGNWQLGKLGSQSEVGNGGW